MTSFDDPGEGREQDGPQPPEGRWALLDFLRSRGARLACPACGHERWRGWSERVAVPRSDEAGMPLEALVAVPLVCENCGLVRLQSARVLDDPRG